MRLEDFPRGEWERMLAERAGCLRSSVAHIQEMADDVETLRRAVADAATDQAALGLIRENLPVEWGNGVVGVEIHLEREWDLETANSRLLET